MGNLLRLKPFSPQTFIGPDWAIWRGPADGNGLQGDEQQDGRSLALQTVDSSQVIFPTCLKEAEGETRIKGEEKLTRLKTGDLIRLDARFGQALWEEEGYKTLEWLRQKKGIIYLDFMGTELRSPDGLRCVLCLYWDEGAWFLHFNWLDGVWGSDVPSAVLASI